jgi:YD repeat-containing protein
MIGSTTRTFPLLSSSCNVPSSAQAYSLNFTAVPKAPKLDFLTTWPAGQTQPLVSTLNASTGKVTANAAIVPAGKNGDISVFVTNDSDLVIDVNGYFAAPANGGLSFNPLVPCRVIDTRNPAGTPPFNGTISANVVSSNCGVSASAQAFALNATVVPPGPLGFLTLWPQGASQPLVSTLNAGDGAITSNMAIVPTSNGSVSAFGSDPTHLILDISGFFAPATTGPPSITAVTPSSGTAGASVTITGTNFGAVQGTGKVTFNGAAASITSWSNTSIRATVPVLVSSGNVVVTSGDGTASNGVSFTIPAPSIGNISPDSARPGTSVTISGTNFGSLPGSLTFNGTAASPITWTNIQIVTPIPAGATTGPVIVTQGGTSNSPAFTVIPPPNIRGIAPTSGPVNTMVTISGSGFGLSQGNGSVQFNGVSAPAFSWSDSSIVVPVPGMATTGTVLVNVGGINSNGIAYTVTPGPSITSLLPASGAPGLAVTITGQNFGSSAGASVVRFNELPAAITSWSATSIGVTVPNRVTTGPVTVTVSGQVSNGATFTATTSGTLSGTVNSSVDGKAVGGATVQALQSGALKASTTTATDGTYSIANLPAGNYDLRISAAGFGAAISNAVLINAGQTSTVNFSLSLPATISGKITQADGVTFISGAKVQILVGSAAGNSASTDATGNYSIGGLNAGTYAVQASATGFVTRSQTASVTGNGTTTANFSLQPLGANPINYIYDELGRLIAVIDSAGDAAIYHYDALGNILSIGRQSSAQLSIISFTPQRGVSGASVTIYGTGFSATAAQDTVQFNGTSANIISATTTQIVAAVPATATTGPITVTTPSGSVTSSGVFTVAANSGAPTITGFTPTMGAPGTSVALTGTNFDIVANDKVSFNGSRGAVTSATSTQVNATVPTTATSGHIAIATPAGHATSVADFFVPFGTHVATDIGFTGRISPGGSQTIALAANQIGLLLFDGSAHQGVSLQLSGSTFSSCTLFIFAPGGAQLTSSSCFSSTNFVGSVTEPLDGTYTIGIDPGTSAGSITIGLTSDVSGVITPGVPITVTTTTAGQNARYLFTGVAGKQVSVSVTNSTYPGCFALTVSVLNPDSTTLGSASTCGSTDFLDSLTLHANGTYTVLISPGGASGGSATVLLSSFNDIRGTIAPGSPVNVTTSFPGQNARYTFSGTTGQQVSLTVTNATYPGCGGFSVSILKPDGTTLSSTFSCSSTAFLDSVTLPVTGTYTVFFDPSGAGTGSATMVLNTFTDISGTITPGTPVTVTTTVAGQNARYTFSGTTGQQVSLSVTNATYPGCGGFSVSILKPDGTTLSSTFSCSSTAFLDSVTLPVTGTYTVFFDPSGTGTGSATIVLNTFTDISGTITPGTPITVTTTVAGQNARYSFSGTTGQHASVSLSASSYPGCTALTTSILNPDGTTLGSTSICSSTGAFGPLALPSTGTYTVFVDPAGTNTGSVTVSLTLAP